MPNFSPKVIKAHPVLWTAITAVLLGVAIYNPVSQLPFFIDDVPHFRWLTSTSFLQIWYSRQGISFYRPLPFAVFKVFWFAQGRYDAPTLHILVLVLHIFNAMMMGLLARRITHRDWAGPVAAALFIVFPFAYQDVTWASGLFHVLLVSGVLLTLLMSFHFLDRGSRFALIGAWIGAVIAIFSHENGVLLPLLVGIILIVTLYNEGILRSRWRQTLWILIPITGLVAVYLFAWVTVPKSANDASNGIQWAGLDTKIVYAAQNVIYPLSALERPFVPNTDSAVNPAMILSTILGVGGAMILLWWLTTRSMRQRRLPAPVLMALVMLAWVAVSTVPTLLFLPVTYVLGSPRLFYLTGTGVVLFWTVWLAGILAQQRRWQVAVIGVVVFASFTLVGMVFAIQRVDAHTRLGSAYKAFFQAVESQPAKPTLLINAPEYIAPTWERTTFLRGAEGAIFFPNYFNLQDLVWANTGAEYPVQAVSFRDVVTQSPDELVKPVDPSLNWDQFDQTLSSLQSVYMISRTGQTYSLVHIGEKGFTTSSSQPLADFGNIMLWDASVTQKPNLPATLSLLWEAKNPLQATPFVHVLCDGAMAAQADGPPLGGIHPFDHWKPGERWIDQRPLSKVCQVSVGLVNPMTGERYKAQLADGSTIDNVQVPVQ